MVNPLTDEERAVAANRMRELDAWFEEHWRFEMSNGELLAALPDHLRPYLLGWRRYVEQLILYGDPTSPAPRGILNVKG